MVHRGLIRPLRAGGHTIHVPSELGTAGQADELHLKAATDLGAVLVTQNQRDFVAIHHRWYEEGRRHGGILLVPRPRTIGAKIAAVERAARLLTPQIAAGQLLELALFDGQEQGRMYIASLEPPKPLS
jgi:hypothetical protein